MFDVNVDQVQNFILNRNKERKKKTVNMIVVFVRDRRLHVIFLCVLLVIAVNIVLIMFVRTC